MKLKAKPLMFRDIKEYLGNQGDILVSKEYNNEKSLLEIECGSCEQIYQQTFEKYKNGNRHQECPGGDTRKYLSRGINRNGDAKKYVTRGISRKLPVYKNCERCETEFVIKPGHRRQRKLCDDCVENFHKNRQEEGYYAQIGRIGGLQSVQSQGRRSKNEIYFADLCIEKFGKENVLCNQPMFDGWDADVVLPKFNMAISWNGIWHYKQVRNGHSVEQVQNRDKLKDIAIKKHGYIHHVIVDMGKADENFVGRMFNNLLNILYFT